MTCLKKILIVLLTITLSLPLCIRKDIEAETNNLNIENFQSYVNGYMYDYSGMHNYHLWSQDQYPWGPNTLGNNARYGSFGAFGCYVTALSKIAISSGTNSIDYINPLKLNSIIKSNNGFASEGNMYSLTSDRIKKSIGAYNAFKISYINNKKDILDYLGDKNHNYQVVLMKKNGSHLISVNKIASLISKDICIDDSFGTGGDNGPRSFNKDDIYRIYKVKPEQKGVDKSKLPFSYYVTNIYSRKVSDLYKDGEIVDVYIYEFKDNNKDNQESIFFSNNAKLWGSSKYTISKNVQVYLFPTDNKKYCIGTLNQNERINISYYGQNSYGQTFYVIKDGEYAGCFFSEDLDNTSTITNSVEFASTIKMKALNFTYMDNNPYNNGNQSPYKLNNGDICDVIGYVIVDNQYKWYKVLRNSTSGSLVYYVYESFLEETKEPESTLKYNNVSMINSSYVKGSTFSFNGMISSNYDFSVDVSLDGLNKGTKKYLSNNSISINSVLKDVGIDFSKLGVGKHTLKILAKDKKKTLDAKTLNFTVYALVNEPKILISDALESKKIELHCTTSGASIYYTIDGSNPSVNSKLYSGNFLINESCAVKAIAYKNGEYSSISSQNIIIYETECPEISYEYTKDGTRVLLTASENATIYYSNNGSYVKYNGPFNVSDGAFIKAYATEYGKRNSSQIEEYVSVKVPDNPIITLPVEEKNIACGNTEILSWKMAGDVGEYEVNIYKDDVLVDTITNIESNSITYTFNDIGIYNYEVKAKNIIGDSEFVLSKNINSIGPKKVRFLSDDNVIHEEIVKYGESANEPSKDPSKRGYTFIGWDKDFNNIKDDLDINAKYKINIYTVVFEDQNGEQIGKELIEFDNQANTPDANVPLKTGYALIGWKIDAESNDSLCDLSHIDSNMKVSAVVSWAKEDLPVIISITKAERDDTNINSNYVVDTHLLNYDKSYTTALLRVSLKTKENKMVRTESRTISLAPNAEGDYTFTFKYPKEYGVSIAEAVLLSITDDGVTDTSLSEAVQKEIIVRKASIGEWSDWKVYDGELPSIEDGYEYECKAQYRSQEKEYTESKTENDTSLTKSGWVQYEDKVTYSSWSDWSPWIGGFMDDRDNYIYEYEYRTEYRYWRYMKSSYENQGAYCDSYKSFNGADYIDFMWSPTSYSEALSGYGGWNRYTTYNSYPVMYYYTGDEGGWNGSNNPSHKYYYFTKYPSLYNELAETREVLRYKKQRINHTYCFYKWSDWNEWQDNQIVSSNDINVETRNVYRYRQVEEIQEMNKEDLSGNIYSFSNIDSDVTYYVPYALPNSATADLSGRLATVMVYKGKNTDPNESQLQHVGQIKIGKDNTFTTEFKTKEAPNKKTGDYIVCLAIEGTSGLFNIGLIEAPKNIYTVEYFDGEGNIISSQNIVEGGNAVVPEAPLREGYSFVGWTESSTNIRKNTQIRPYEVKNKCSVAIVDWHNSNVQVSTIDYNTKIKDILPIDNPTAVGYKFNNWQILDESSGDLVTVDNQTITEDTIIYANYDAQEFTVTFYDSDKETKKIVSQQKVLFGESAELPASPVYDDLLFLGWDSDSRWWNITGNVDVYPITMYKETTADPIVNLDEYIEGSSERLVIYSEDEAKIYCSINEEEPIEYKEPIVLDKDLQVEVYAESENKNRSKTKIITFIKNEEEGIFEDDLVEMEKYYPLVSGEEEITLSIDIAENEGLASYLFFIECDRSKYYVDQNGNAECVINGGKLSENGFIFASDYAEGYKVLWVGNDMIAEDGNLFSITLKTYSDIEEGTYPIKISYSKSNTIDSNYEELEPYVENRFSTDKLVGDVTGDGKVTVADVIKILKYIIGKDTFTFTQSKLADVTNDGKINNSDVVRIARFIVGAQDLR